MDFAEHEITIAADEAHCTLRQPEGVDAPAYLIPPTPRLILDVFGYDLLCVAAMEPFEDAKLAVHVVRKGAYYFGKWPVGKTRMVLDAESLQPGMGFTEFAGFDRGEFVVIIGLEKEIDESVEFLPVWLGGLGVEVVH